MPWSIDEKGIATVEFDGAALETKLRALAEDEFPQVANYPTLRGVQVVRDPPGGNLKIVMVFTNE